MQSGDLAVVMICLGMFGFGAFTIWMNVKMRKDAINAFLLQHESEDEELPNCDQEIQLNPEIRPVARHKPLPFPSDDNDDGKPKCSWPVRNDKGIRWVKENTPIKAMQATGDNFFDIHNFAETPFRFIQSIELSPRDTPVIKTNLDNARPVYRGEWVVKTDDMIRVFTDEQFKAKFEDA